MANRDSKFNAGIIFGAVVGGLAAYFLSPRTGKENREMFKKKIKELNKMLEEGELKDRVREIYGDVTEQSKKTYTLAREELDTRLNDVKKSVDDIDKDKYKSILDDVITRVQDETKESVDRLTQLRDYFMEKFNQTKGEVKKDAGSVKKEVKKAVTVPPKMKAEQKETSTKSRSSKVVN